MIVAVVVLYHPNLILLDRLLTSLDDQVDKVIAVDNTPGRMEALPTLLEKFAYPVQYIPLGNNKGIAKAQNVGIREGIKSGGAHVLLLDQDSVLPQGTVASLLAAEGKLLAAGVNVAAVGPLYMDEKTGAPSCAVRHAFLRVRKISLNPGSSEPVETDSLIASGSIIRAAALRSVGWMRDDLFIDFVDTEWCFRAQSKGFRSFCVPQAIMMHSIGDTAIKVFGKNVYLHSDVRKYYRLRNAIFLLRLPSMGWRWRSYILPWIPYYLFLNLWISTGKREISRVLLKGLRDGFSGRLGPLGEEPTIQ